MKKKCLITGASKGIGKALALQLGELGYNLALLARTEDELVQIKSILETKSVSVLTYAVDLADIKQTETAINNATDQWGAFDVLVNNAGIGFFGDMEAMELSEWDRLMSVNVRASFYVTKLLVEGMKQQKSGHIITVASDVSKRVFAEGAAYCASKYAQDAMFSALRKQLHIFGIKISMVYPGLVDTAFHANDDPESSSWLKPEDVADSIRYILQAPKNVVIDELMIHPMSQAY